MIVIDTRQQAGKHKHKEEVWAQLGVQSVRSKLIAGDYARLDNQTVSVDTKKDFVELARKCGIRLVVLVEEVPPSGDLALWQSPKTRSGKPFTHVKGSVLKKAMATMTERYGVEFESVTKEKAPFRILEILGEEVFI